MITLRKDGKVMEVEADFQAVAFERNGWTRVVSEPKKAVETQPVENPLPVEKPAKAETTPIERKPRGRRKKEG